MPYQKDLADLDKSQESRFFFLFQTRTESYLCARTTKT